MQRRELQTVDSYARRGEAQPQPHEEYTQPAPLARRTTFVPPAPQPAQSPAQPAPLESFNVPSPAQSMVELRTSYTDRAKGFVWAITPVAAVTGVLSCVAGVTLFAVPLLSWTLLQTFLAFFCVTWIVGYGLHLLMSPDGALLLNTVFLWRTVQREQEDRHRRYWTAYQDARQDARRDGRQ